jgi:hypothetical protein
MGRSIGAFNEDEVKNLSLADREKLKRQAIRLLQGSKEIRALMKSEPKLFTKIKDVKKILRKKLTPVRKRMAKR